MLSEAIAAEKKTKINNKNNNKEAETQQCSAPSGVEP